MNERGEAAYTHAEQAERHARCWPADVSLASSHGFHSAELEELRPLALAQRIGPAVSLARAPGFVAQQLATVADDEAMVAAASSSASG